MKRIIIAALALFLAVGAGAQITSVTPSASKVKQYDNCLSFFRLNVCKKALH